MLVVEDVGYLDHSEPVRRTHNDLNLVTGLEHPFYEDPQVNAMATGVGEAFREPVGSDSDAELIAGDARLDDLQEHAATPQHSPTIASDRSRLLVVRFSSMLPGPSL